MFGKGYIITFVNITYGKVNRIACILSVVCWLMVTSCGDSSEFRIAGIISGLGTQNLWLYYYTDDAVHSRSTIVIDGKFSVVGHSEEPAMVELYTTDKVLLSRLLIKNGETVDCEIDRADRYKVSYKGNKVSQEWGKFLSDNAEVLSSSSQEKNALIEKYVKSNRSNMLSTLLLITEYDAVDNELMADSLLQMIAPEARPRNLAGHFEAMLEKVNSETARSQVKRINLYSAGDSIYVFNPALSSYSILAFSDIDKTMRDTVVAGLCRLADDYNGKRLNVVDIAFATDTLKWHKAIADDDARWKQCWSLGGVESKGIDRLAVPRTPYFIVVDSAGTQLFRGSSITEASMAVDEKLTR